MDAREGYLRNITHLLLAAGAGLLLTASFPRYGHPLVAWVALVPLFGLAAARDPRTSFKLGWFAGICHGLTLLYWIVYVINHYGSLPFVVSLAVCFLLVAYLAIYPALFCATLSWLRERRLPWLLLSPFLWVSLELAKSKLLTGFPWENLGYSQYRWLPLIQIAEITGVYGLSFAVVLGNAALFHLLARRKRRWKSSADLLPFLSAVGLVFGLYIFGTWKLGMVEDQTGPAFQVAMVQGNIAQENKWDPAFQKSTLRRYFRLTREVVKDDPQLLVWPETATPFYFQADTENRKALLQKVRQWKVPLLFGSPAYGRPQGDLRLYNRAYLLDESSRIVGYYDKIHLVPFGEYVPLKRMLFFVDKLVQATGDFASGGSPELLPLPPARLGVLICYEAIFPELNRRLVAGGANLLVNITNDAWFGRSSAPYQHLSMATFRAVENRVPVVRCANTGISAFIDRRGRILQATGLFEEAALSAEIQLGGGRTVYCRYGDWFALGSLAVCATGFLLGLWRRSVDSGGR